ncbi:MAG: helix-turn-helix transcriptional regulator [Candidatus Zophobacter franzmannii]|jgi:transcriptional regulator with XRE-family HTH domain|nr:helix-turn-helix transcriptional regulator [Candidatus Zophobacter franzmannii]
MKQDLMNTIDSLFGEEPTPNQKAWSIINQFYHLILTKMTEDSITRADLAKSTGKSRSAITQMFNKTPNLTIKKLVEIADAVGLEINLTSKPFLDDENKASVRSNYFSLSSNEVYSVSLEDHSGKEDFVACPESSYYIQPVSNRFDELNIS